MNVLYLGKYGKRFEPVIQHIKGLLPGSRVLELCFGDIYVADFCKRAGYPWTGLDLNARFVETAKKRHFNAHEADLFKVKELPESDICILMGSFYHFHTHALPILRMMFQAADQVIISEPVMNLSAKTGLIGRWAKKGANAGSGHEIFRYNEGSLMAMLESNSSLVGYRVVSKQQHGKDLVVKLEKSEKH